MCNVFQIFLCREQYREENLRNHADFFESAKNSILSIYPDHQYQLYTNVEAAKFVKDFSPEVHRAYWKLAPFAYRADLLRLCLLYKYGGWYFDLTTKPLFRFDPDKDFFARNDTLIYKNTFGQDYNLIENFVLFSKPKSKFLELCISEIVSNTVHQRYFSEWGTLRISGPALLSYVLDKHNYLKDTLIVGNFENPIRSIVVNNKIFAVHKTKNLNDPLSPSKIFIDGISHIGFKGVNSYNYLCNLRALYITPWTAAVIRDMTDISDYTTSQKQESLT